MFEYAEQKFVAAIIILAFGIVGLFIFFPTKFVDPNKIY